MLSRLFFNDDYATRLLYNCDKSYFGTIRYPFHLSERYLPSERHHEKCCWRGFFPVTERGSVFHVYYSRVNHGGAERRPWRRTQGRRFFATSRESSLRIGLRDWSLSISISDGQVRLCCEAPSCIAQADPRVQHWSGSFRPNPSGNVEVVASRLHLAVPVRGGVRPEGRSRFAFQRKSHAGFAKLDFRLLRYV